MSKMAAGRRMEYDIVRPLLALLSPLFSGPNWNRLPCVSGGEKLIVKPMSVCYFLTATGCRGVWKWGGGIHVASQSFFASF